MDTKFFFNRHWGNEGVFENIYTKNWKGPNCALSGVIF